MKKIYFFLLIILILPVIVFAYDDSHYNLIVLKIDASSTRLDGSTFVICSDENCNNIISTSSIVYDYGDSGYREFNIELNFNQVYYLKETIPPKGYQLRTLDDGTPYVWNFNVKKSSTGSISYEVGANGEKTYLYGSGWQYDTHYTYKPSKTGKLFLEIRNAPAAHLLVHKEDEQGNVLEGVKYKLTCESRGEEEIATTDSNGNAIFDNLLNPKDYIIEEIETLPGYALDITKYPFYIDDSNSNYNLYPRQYSGNYKYTVGVSNHYGVFSNYYYNIPEYIPRNDTLYYSLVHKDRKAPNYLLKIVKKDDKNKPVKNKEYDVSTDESCSNVIESGKTNANGELIITNLVSSQKYYICEHRGEDETPAKPIEVKLVHVIDDSSSSSSIKGTRLYINGEESISTGSYNQALATVNVKENLILIPQEGPQEENNDNEKESSKQVLVNPPTNKQDYIILAIVIFILSIISVIILNKYSQKNKYLD